VAVRPGTGGVFEIRVDGETLWSREADGGFPDLPELEHQDGGHLRPHDAPVAPR
jgi:selenoprotein W-related protein